jgi:hypothetical protein
MDETRQAGLNNDVIVDDDQPPRCLRDIWIDEAIQQLEAAAAPTTDGHVGQRWCLGVERPHAHPPRRR